MFRLLLPLLLICSAASANQGLNALLNTPSSTPDFLPIEQAYQLQGELQSENQLYLNWQIAEGYYLYRHSFAFRVDDSAASSVSIPTGKQQHDEYFGDVEVYYHQAEATLSELPTDHRYQFSVTYQGCADAGLCYPPHTEHFSVDPEQRAIQLIDPETSATPATSQRPQSDTPPDGSLLLMLAFALLGGAILNLMPCVFPVLSLKILSFANDDDHRPALHGVSYTVGVVISFLVIASLLLALQHAGSAVGWGFQLQSPWFVAALIYLFFLIGLNLMGYFEIGLSWMNLGSRLSLKPGYLGSFFTGALATVVASPCTAPFMGSALGFAITQPASSALAVFAALGFGMALPVLLLCLSPELLKRLPRPGNWMVRFRQLLAFPIFATAIWLCWVLGNQVGSNGIITVLIGLTLLVFAIWLARPTLLNRAVATVAIAAAIYLLNTPMLEPSSAPSHTDSGPWQSYSAERLDELRQSGQPVFINATADWCITCLANEKVALSNQRVLQAFRDHNVQLLKADWTNRDPAISQLLEQYRRSGVPLYLLYPSDTRSAATVLPQILTPQRVIDALQLRLSATPQP